MPSCGTAAGAGDIDALVTLPVGTSATFTVSGTVPAGTTGALINTATVTPPVGVTDPVPGNNAATDSNPVGPQADLSITKASSPNPYVPGALLSYTMVVSNIGPSNVTNARVQDALPAALAGFSWTCTPSGVGASCGTAAGHRRHRCAGDAAGGDHCDLHGERDGAAGDHGRADQHGDGDPAGWRDRSGAGQQRRDRQQPGGIASRPDHQQGEQSRPVRPGALLSYSIVVTNTGPSNVTNARVQDALPAALAGFSWTCTPSGAGSSCASPAGTETSMRW